MDKRISHSHVHTQNEKTCLGSKTYLLRRGRNLYQIR